MEDQQSNCPSNELQHALDINNTLYAIANAVNTTSDLPTLYREIHKTLGTVLDVTNFYIAIVDNALKQLTFPYHVDEKIDIFQPITNYDGNHSLTGLVVTSQRAVLLREEALKELSTKRKMKGPTPECWLGVPLWIEGIVTGVVAVQSYTNANCYSQKDLEVMTMVSDQIALAISRKQAEERVVRSEQRYRTLFEKSKDAILIIRNRQFVDCNQATVEMLGYESKHQLLQTHPSKLSPPRQPDGRESYEKAEEMMAIAVKNGSHRFEWDHLKADGTVFPVEVLLTTISAEEGNQEIHTIWRDITERKTAEAELRNSRRRMASILEANPDPMVVYDLDGYPLYLNPAFTKVFGWTLDELEGRKIPFIPGDQKEMTVEVIKEILEHGKPISFETQRLTKDGQVLDILVSAALNRNEQDENIGFIANLTNITERKKLEAQYKQAQKMEAIGTLAGGIAHDFNNILSAIFGYAHLAEHDLNDTQKAKSYLSQIMLAAKRAAELVQQILTFSRRSDYQKQPLILSLIIKEAIKLLRSSIPTSIAIATRIDTEAAILADPTRMHQVIINLATNASHAMAKNGGTMTIALSEEEIDDTGVMAGGAPRAGKYLCLSVTDTGHGMDKQTLERAFEPYFTTKEIGKGTGFGLALVHAIIEEHDGFIKVESAIDQGSTFLIYLPVFETKVATATVRKMRQAIDGDESIMVVDDETSIRLIAQEVLERYGYTVSLFDNGADALAAFTDNPDNYDLIISDMAMPIMTGDQLAEKVLQIDPFFPIILCTGFSEYFSEEQAYQLGVRKFLYKPVATRDLVVAIRDVLDAGQADDGNDSPLPAPPSAS